MKIQKKYFSLAVLFLCLVLISSCDDDDDSQPQTYTIDLSSSNLALHNTAIVETTFLGEDASQFNLTESFANQILMDGAAGTLDYSPNGVGVFSNFKMHNGTIEFDMALELQAGFPPFIRGFGGIAFRLKTADSYDCIYLRGTNGSLNNPPTIDPVRLGHAIQYIQAPDYEFQQLRDDFPEVYENPAAMAIDSWHHYKLVVKEKRAEFYIDNATTATIVIENMFGENIEGDIALWCSIGTNAYFKNILVTK